MSLTTAFVQKFVYRGGSPFLHVRKWWERISTLDTYFRRRKVGAVLAGKVTPADKIVIDELRAAGFVILPSPLPMTDELVTESRRILADYIAENKSDSEMSKLGIHFMASLLRDKTLSLDSIYLRYASQERLMTMASDYLGEAAYLSNVSLIYSFEDSQVPSSTQMWHRDYDDTRMFKVFVYCSDVDTPEDGALHVADRRAVKYMYRTPLHASRRFGDADFFKMADKSKTKALCGPSGTTLICDTHRAYHYGSRCTERPRLACFITYQSYAGLYRSAHVVDPPADASEPLKLLLAKTPA
jgi:hypothetical protein